MFEWEKAAIFCECELRKKPLELMNALPKYHPASSASHNSKGSKSPSIPLSSELL